MKKIIIAFLMVCLATTVFAEKIFKIGIIDIDEILSSYLTEKAVWEGLADMMDEINTELEKIDQEILNLKRMKLEAMNKGDDDEQLRLENEIMNREEYQRTYYNVMKKQYDQEVERFKQDSEVMEKILSTIDYEAVNNGYSIIMDTDGTVWWWSPDTDVTDNILKRLGVQ